jgi:hypothetical protein
MIYIGNYASWVDPLWEHKVLTTTGQAMPRDKYLLTKEQLCDEANNVQYNQYQTYTDAGYSMNDTNWWIYEKEHLNLGELTVPWSSAGRIHYWFTKMMPGQYMPMHRDPHVFEEQCNRYWVAIQDYEPGHIFIYKDEMLKDYKAGDVFQFVNNDDIHGAANISFSPRIALQITEYVS